MNLKVISCSFATPEGGGYEGNCPFYDPEFVACCHPSKVGTDPAGSPHDGVSIGFGNDDSVPEWCPLREGAVTVHTDAIKFTLRAGPITLEASEA